MTRELTERWQTALDAFAVDPEIFARWPDYRVLIIAVDGLDRASIDRNAGAGETALDRAEAAMRAAGVADWATDPHIARWMQAFSDFGVKPKKYSPSVLALLKRLDAGLPRIDPLTDLYNAISITHRISIGGENLAAYVGKPRLCIATGDEPFDTVDKGEPVVDHPSAGEVVWRDDAGVTCRRWNWRQCVRTRLDAQTETAFFLFDALGPLSDAELQQAGDELIAGLVVLSPDVAIGQRIVRA